MPKITQPVCGGLGKGPGWLSSLLWPILRAVVEIRRDNDKKRWDFFKNAVHWQQRVCVGILTRLGVGSGRGAFRDFREPSRREAAGRLGLYRSSAEFLAHDTKQIRKMNKWMERKGESSGVKAGPVWHAWACLGGVTSPWHLGVGLCHRGHSDSRRTNRR